MISNEERLLLVLIWLVSAVGAGWKFGDAPTSFLQAGCVCAAIYESFRWAWPKDIKSQHGLTK